MYNFHTMQESSVVHQDLSLQTFGTALTSHIQILGCNHKVVDINYGVFSIRWHVRIIGRLNIALNYSLGEHQVCDFTIWVTASSHTNSALSCRPSALYLSWKHFCCLMNTSSARQPLSKLMKSQSLVNCNSNQTSKRFKLTCNHRTEGFLKVKTFWEKPWAIKLAFAAQLHHPHSFFSWTCIHLLPISFLWAGSSTRSQTSLEWIEST